MVLASWAVLVGAALVGIVRGAHYGDYAAAEMPHYGSEEYHESAREAAPAVNDYNDRSPEAPASPDYKYEEHLNLRTVNIKTQNSWQKSTLKPSRIQRPNLRAHVDRNKIKSTFHQRKRSRNSVKKDDVNEKQLRNGRIRSNDIIDNEEDFIGNDRYQDRFEDNKVYTRATTERVVKRKPRDRSFRSPEIEIENDESEDDDDEELKNEHSHVKDAEYSATEESVALPVQSDESKQLGTNEETEAFRQQSPIRTDDDLISRLEAKKLDQKKEDQYQDYYDMKRVNNIKKKITVLYRRTKDVESSSPTIMTAVVAERELRALLGGHRQRKEVPNEATDALRIIGINTSVTTGTLPTFRPNAVESRLIEEWSEFISRNKAMDLQFSMYIVFLVVINYLQR